MFESLKQRWRESPALPGARPPAATGVGGPGGELRPSNGLKQFFWELGGRERPAILDLGPVWQSTVQVLADFGCKIYSEDCLGELADALHEPVSASLAERFLGANLRYAPESLDGVIIWDILDLVPAELVEPLVARLREVLRPGGVVLAFFHNRREESFCFRRYRVVARDTIEMLEAPGDWQPQRIFQNRTLLNLFAAFHASKTFLSRDNLREALFVK